MKRFLIIQTAFIGDVILATALVESIAQKFPDAKIDFLLRKGNENILENNPHIHEVIIWDKKSKWKSFWQVIKKLRTETYDQSITLQRFFSAALITLLIRSHKKSVFSNSPLSFLHRDKKPHIWGDGTHEIERNHQLLGSNFPVSKPKVYPSEEDQQQIVQYQNEPYLVMAPNSVWFTKTLPINKWVELIRQLGNQKIYLIGAPSDHPVCESIADQARNNVDNLAGQLSLLQSAALMQGAVMNYVNDSAPLHLCSATNSPVTAFFCSTTEKFGFGPLSDQSNVLEKLDLECKPCGKHGHKSCPRGHFKCSEIPLNEAL